MHIFIYDKTFEGLLTCVFDAYLLKTFPDMLVEKGDTLPIFYDSLRTIESDHVKADRVWKGLGRKLSEEARAQISECWMADGYPHVDELLFRYIHKAIDGPAGTGTTSSAAKRETLPGLLQDNGRRVPESIEVNFSDPDVLALSRVYKQVRYEVQRMKMFVRFQKAADGTYFAPFEPQHDVLPMAVDHFRDRFGDQKWIIYDIKRGYGFHFDLSTVREVTFTDEAEFLKTGLLDKTMLDPDELLLQNMWKAYFKSICIRERLNPRKHRQDMPVRYWKHLTEKQR